MSMPPSLIYFVERLQGVSTNTFRLETQNKKTAKAGDIISFDMPSNAILNLRSLKVFCQASADAGASNAGARLPPINDLVERVEVSVGGIVLSQGTNFVNVLNEAKRSLGAVEVDAVLGHPEYVRKVSYVNGLGAGSAQLSTTLNEKYEDTDPNYFCIDKFHGFLDTAEPRLMDTSLIPDMKVRLYMASNNVLTTSEGTAIGSSASRTGPPAFEAGFCRKGSGGAAYELSNIFATVECIGLADGTYDAMLSSMMSQQGFLEVPYKSYTSFQETHSGSSRFTVSTSSLDRVWVTFRDTGFNAQDAPITVQGHKKAGGFVNGSYISVADQTASPSGTTIDLGISQYDVGGVLNTDTEKYKSKYFNFAAPQPNMTMQLQLNGAYMAQFPADIATLYGITKNSLMGNKTLTHMSYDQYINNHFVTCFRLNLPDSEYSRMLSGLDTRAVNLQGIVATVGSASGGGRDNLAINIFTESTETLRIGAGRTIQVIS